MLSEISQTEKVENHTISLICGIKLKATNKTDKQTKTHRHRQQFSDYQKERTGGSRKGREGQIYGGRRRFDFGW